MEADEEWHQVINKRKKKKANLCSAYGSSGCEHLSCSCPGHAAHQEKPADRELNNITEEQWSGEWVKMDMVLDSGAVDTVGPNEAASNVATRPSEASESGVHYKAANGSKIPNLGEKDMSF